MQDEFVLLTGPETAEYAQVVVGGGITVLAPSGQCDACRHQRHMYPGQGRIDRPESPNIAREMLFCARCFPPRRRKFVLLYAGYRSRTSRRASSTLVMRLGGTSPISPSR